MWVGEGLERRSDGTNWVLGEVYRPCSLALRGGGDHAQRCFAHSLRLATETGMVPAACAVGTPPLCGVPLDVPPFTLGWGYMALAEATAVRAPLDVREATSDRTGNPRMLPVWGVAGEAAVRAVVCQTEYTWDCDWAIGVVGCESGGNPAAVGTEFYSGRWWAFIGWWQIAVPYDAWLRGKYRWLFDPKLNTVEAHIKYVADGRAPWPVCGR